MREPCERMAILSPEEEEEVEEEEEEVEEVEEEEEGGTRGREREGEKGALKVKGWEQLAVRKRGQFHL